MPTSTATVRSASTVSENVAAQTAMSAFGEPQDAAYLSPLAHVVGHDEQNRGQRRQRNEAGQRRRDEQDDQQRQRVNDPGDRASSRRSGCSSLCGRWRRWPGCRRPAARDVGHALGDELRVGLVPSPLMLSATTAESRLSIAARIATVNAEGKQRQDQIRTKLRQLDSRRQAQSGCRRTCCRSSRPAYRKTRRRRRPASSATM